MKLWSFQSPAVYQLLQAGQPYRCDPTLSEGIQHMEFQEAYKWMAEQMRKRIGAPPAGIALPVWAWHTWDWKQKKPDLRRMEFHYRKDQYLLELELRDNAVLLSDMDNWNAVLGGYYNNPSTCETEWEQLEDTFDALPAEERQCVMIQSWEEIFDVTPFNNSWHCCGRYVQATTWEIRPEQVIKSWFVPGREKR